jgi:hypothetical protein
MKLFDLSTSEFKTLLNVLTSFKSQKSVTIYDSCIEMVSKNGTYIFSNMFRFFHNQDITAKFNTNKSGIKSLRRFLDNPADIEFHHDTAGTITLKQDSLKKTLPIPKKIPFINTNNISNVSTATLGSHFLNSFDGIEPISIEMDSGQINTLYLGNNHYDVKTEQWVINHEEYIPTSEFIVESKEFLPFEADKFNIEICFDPVLGYLLVISYVIDGIQVFAYGMEKEETEEEKKKKEKEKKKEKKKKEKEKKYMAMFPLTSKQWERFGVYSVLPDLKKKDRVITDISPTSYDKLLEYLCFFLTINNLNITDGVINHQTEFIIRADLREFFTGATEGINFMIEDVQELIEKLRDVFGTGKVDSIRALLTSRANIVVIEKKLEPVDPPLPFDVFDNHLCLFSSLPIPINEKNEYSTRRLNLKAIENPPSVISFQGAIPKSNKLSISKESRNSLSGKQHYVLISLFGCEISNLQKKVNKADHGITAELIDELPTMILKSEHFLNYEADEYEISVVEKDGYWLETVYTLVGQPIKTYEKLTVLTPNIIEKIVEKTGMRAQLNRQQASLTLDFPDDQNALSKIHGIMEILINLDEKELHEIYKQYVRK